MPNLTDLTGLVSIASAASVFMLLLPGMADMTKPRLALLLAAVFVLMLIPFGGMPLAAYVRGVTGDLSITTLALLWCALLQPGLKQLSQQNKQSRHTLLILIALAALALYPMALGVGTFDPYRLGYSNPLFVAALLLIAVTTWFRRFYLVALCITLATLSWAIGWYESDNIWDYLLDPFVAIYALSVVITGAVKMHYARFLP